MRLVILGAGGYGHTIWDLAQQSNRYEDILFLDDKAEAAAGKCADYSGFSDGDTEFYPAFGNNEARLHWLDKLCAEGLSVMTLIHPTAYVSPMAEIGVGTVVLPKAIVNTDVKIGRGVIVNCGAIIDHGCVIGDGVHICLGAIVKAENKLPPLMKVEAGQIIANRTYQ